MDMRDYFSVGSQLAQVIIKDIIETAIEKPLRGMMKFRIIWIQISLAVMMLISAVLIPIRLIW